MASWFRRNKPDAQPERRSISIEELAAAFPKAPAQATLDARDTTEELAAAFPDAATRTVHDAGAGSVEERAAAFADSPASAARANHATGPAVAPSPPAVADVEATEPWSHVVPQPPREQERPTAAAKGKPGWRERLGGSVFARSFGGLFSRNPKLDDDLLDRIEEALLTADVGVTASTEIVESLRKRMKARAFADAEALRLALRADLVALLAPVARPLQIDASAKPFVILTVGVNGVGKTTTIGKLARRYKDEGRSLMLAAGDTFRAAAVAQLQAWGERNGVAVVAQGQNADAASVAFDALQAAKSRGVDVLIADTAGRLHTQQGLMAELGKIGRVLQKIDPAAPHEVLMVIDGTTGQNAISQVRQFNAVARVTGLVVTKLDGTAKGGVVFALAREFGIPIRYAGIGEQPEDLRVFDADAFVDALLPNELGRG
ncbi:MAG: signal recognition particle-docking protein FtsY [Pseudomonadota bacterium]